MSKKLYAKTISDILKKTRPSIIERGSGITPKLDDQVLEYTVKGSSQDYKVQVKFISPTDVLVKCSCPAWVFQGSEYHASKNKYLLGDPRGNLAPPDRRDPNGENLVCKHAAAVLKNIEEKQGIRVASRRQFLHYFREDICENQNDEDIQGFVNTLLNKGDPDFEATDESSLAYELVSRYPKKFTYSLMLHSVLIEDAVFNYRTKGKVRPKKSFPYITFTPHAIVRAALRGVTCYDIRDAFYSYLDTLYYNPNKLTRFVKKMNEGSFKFKASSERVGLLTIRMKLGTGAGHTDQKGGFIELVDEGDVVSLKLSPNTSFRVHMVYPKRVDGLRGGLERSHRVHPFDVLPCLRGNLAYENMDEEDVWIGHKEKKEDPNYRWEGRFAKRVALRWLEGRYSFDT